MGGLAIGRLALDVRHFINMPFTAAEIAGHLQGQVVGDPATVLNNFAPADRAQAGDLTFAENEGYFTRAEQSAASAIIVAGESVSTSKVLIRVSNARVAFAKALALFFPEPVLPAGVHPTAVVTPTAQVDATAHVGPHCVIGERVRIGARAVLHGGNFVGADCRVSEDVVLFPNVTLYPRTELGQRVRIHAGAVIGSDGAPNCLRTYDSREATSVSASMGPNPGISRS